MSPKMRKNLHTIILLLLLVTSENVFGKEVNKTKVHKSNKKHNSLTEEQLHIERIKRSTDDEEDKPFWANRGKKNIDYNRYYYDMEKVMKSMKNNDHNMGKVSSLPFPSRSERSSVESRDESADYDQYNCKNCYGTIRFDSGKNFKDRRDDSLGPFWGNRGRRSSNEVEEDEPFWGNRGRRQDDEPFWGARGRREEEPFWGTRGRRDEVDPFWGNRGRREDTDPFWGNRGRRQGIESFWGESHNEDEPFWGNRGRRKEYDPFQGNDGRRKEDLKESILKAIDMVETDIERLSRFKKPDQSFWANRGRDSNMKYLFNSDPRNPMTPHQIRRTMKIKTDPSTVHDSRMYAEEPQFILVERNSRSSSETEDPYYISRGKKYYLNYNMLKAARDRRGAIEEIVKSVRNDPFYIARGKKDIKINSTENELQKAKDLICSAIDLITDEDQNGKVKREIDIDRDRRTILKKLAARLQIDPFPISRGKKSVGNESNLHEFITNIATKCN